MNPPPTPASPTSSPRSPFAMDPAGSGPTMVSPPASTRRSRPQLSLRMLMLMNIIFCVIAGALYWASRVPAVTDELDMLLGGRGGSEESEDRTTHVIFVMFTYTAPLLLAGLLSSFLAIWNLWMRRRAAAVRGDGDE